MKEYIVQLKISMTVAVYEDESLCENIGEELKNVESLNEWDVIDIQERTEKNWD